MSIKLIEAGKGDTKLEWKFYSELESENGFENLCFGCSYEEYVKTKLVGFQNSALGIGLPNGHVPQTTFFLYDDSIIVGVYKVRHYVNDVIRVNGVGHIGYAIAKEHRGKGYATEGLKLAIQELIKMPDYDKKDNIIMGAHKNNPASIRVQQKCGAKIVGETEEDYISVIEVQ